MIDLIFSRPFTDLSGGTVGLSSHATPKRFRFVECLGLPTQNRLDIYEGDSIDGISYAAISYVWAGKPHVCTDVTKCLGSFHVVGATDSGGDPIYIDILQTAALAALQLNCGFLWIDQVCIMQADPEDRRWQVMGMYEIYKNCEACLVFPGGLGQLVGLQDETEWITRAWTQQEAMAPKNVMCVFHFDLIGPDVASWFMHGTFPFGIRLVQNGYSAMVSLDNLLQGAGSLSLTLSIQREGTQHQEEIPMLIEIFGKYWSLTVALMGSLNLKDVDSRENAMWRGTWMRTAKYDIDQVYSIMGAFGVTLDTSLYLNKYDVMIALRRAILAKGGRANWLAESLARGAT
jgi:hypothetical protein